MALLDLGPLPGGRTWWHFGAHERRLARFAGTIHIPIRRPVDVARSWARRPMPGRPLEALLRSYNAMFDFLARAGECCRLHVMEAHPRLAGAGELPQARAGRHRRRAFERAVRDHVVAPRREFWERFYPDVATR